MTHTRLITLLILFLCATVASTMQQASTPQPTALTVGSATVDEIKGDVKVSVPNGQPATPQRGQVLEPETLIETTKGSAVLHLEDGSQVLVKSGSRVVLKSPKVSSGEFLQLLIGKILAKVQKRVGATPSFRMWTPTAVVTVRGTRFEVSVDKQGKTFVEVYEGVVQVASIGALDHPVLLGPGYHTSTQQNELPERPRRALDPFGEMGRPDGPSGRDAEHQARPGDNNPTRESEPNREPD